MNVLHWKGKDEILRRGRVPWNIYDDFDDTVTHGLEKEDAGPAGYVYESVDHSFRLVSLNGGGKRNNLETFK